MLTAPRGFLVAHECFWISNIIVAIYVTSNNFCIQMFCNVIFSRWKHALASIFCCLAYLVHDSSQNSDNSSKSVYLLNNYSNYLETGFKFVKLEFHSHQWGGILCAKWGTYVTDSASQEAQTDHLNVPLLGQRPTVLTTALNLLRRIRKTILVIIFKVEIFKWEHIWKWLHSKELVHLSLQVSLLSALVTDVEL